MIHSRHLAFAAILCLGAPAARAQATLADLDALSEGQTAATFVTPAGTFRDLVLDGVGTPGVFAVDDASATLAGLERFTPPNVIVPGGFVAGPTLAIVPVQSFRIVLPVPTRWVRFTFFLEALGANNTLQVQFFQGGQPFGSTTFVGPGYPTWHASVLGMCSPLGLYDEVRFVGSGPTDGGRFSCAIDSLVVAGAPCNPGQPFCAANTVGGCPCGNFPMTIAPAGCAHSFGDGGLLQAGGIASITVDELVILLFGMPPSSTGILVQANIVSSGSVFGDGVLCLTAPVMRVLSCTADSSGLAHYPSSGDAPVSVRAGLMTSGTRSYQFVYRNVASFCTSSPFNVTNGVSIPWTF